MNLTEIQYPVYMSPVPIGLFCVYLPKVGFVAGGPIPTPTPYPNQELIGHFNALQAYKSEIVLYGYLVSVSTSPVELEAILNSQAKVPSDLRFYVADGFHEGNKVKFEARLLNIRTIINSIADYKKVIDLSVYLVNNASEVKKYYLEFLEDGEVGYTLRDPNNLVGEVLLKVGK